MNLISNIIILSCFDCKATIRHKRLFVPSDNSSQATIRPKFQKATIRPKFQKATIRPKRLFVPSDNSSQATIRPKRLFVPFRKGNNLSQLLKAAIRLQFNCQFIPL